MGGGEVVRIVAGSVGGLVVLDKHRSIRPRVTHHAVIWGGTQRVWPKHAPPSVPMPYAIFEGVGWVFIVVYFALWQFATRPTVAAQTALRFYLQPFVV